MLRKSTFILFVLLLGLTSCFEIIEEINMNKDGSGTFKYTINLSQSKTKLASIILMDSINGYSVPTEKVIRDNVTYLKQRIAATQGINNISTALNFEEFIFNLSCNFDNVQALNKLVMQVEKMGSPKEQYSTDSVHFSWNGEEFERFHNFNIAPVYSKLNAIDKKVFEGASYRSIQRFEADVKVASNSSSRISKSKKAVMIQVPIRDLLLNQTPIKNKITLSL